MTHSSGTKTVVVRTVGRIYLDRHIVFKKWGPLLSLRKSRNGKWLLEFGTRTEALTSDRTQAPHFKILKYKRPGVDVAASQLILGSL